MIFLSNGRGSFWELDMVNMFECLDTFRGGDQETKGNSVIILTTGVPSTQQWGSVWHIQDGDCSGPMEGGCYLSEVIFGDTLPAWEQWEKIGKPDISGRLQLSTSEAFFSL